MGGINLNKKIKALIAGILAAVFTISACAPPAAPAQTSASQPGQVSHASATARPVPVTSVAAIAGEDDPREVKTPRSLSVILPAADPGYTPFSPDSDYDRFMDAVTGARLMETGRLGKVMLKGVIGQKENVGGEIYQYSGLSDVSVKYDKEADTSTYDIKLREGVKFSDGEELDADDLIFTLYVLLDPSYNGASRLPDMDIKGLINYRYDNVHAEEITDEQIAEALSSEEVIKIIQEKIIVPALTEQFATVETLYSDSSYDTYTKAYPRPEALFAFFYSLDSEYKPEAGFGKSKVISDIAQMYGGNYKLLGSMISGEEDTYERRAVACAIEHIANDGQGGGVSTIAGIKKTGSHSVTVTANGRSSELTRALADVIVAPLHYYGDTEKYSYGGGKFGFDKGNTADVLAKHAGEPLGAGAYRFISADTSGVCLAANNDYYKGAPLTEKINVITAAGSSPAEAIAAGNADIAYIGGSAAELTEIDEINRSIKKLELGIGKDCGYGYIGINAATVNIGGEPLSHQSAMLRKALATAINYYKEESVKNYFGENAVTADYPVIRGVNVDIQDSVQSPSQNTEQSENEEEPVRYKPYTVGASGLPFITEEMKTESEKLDALTGVIGGFLTEAGYTLEDGKVTAVPEGGKTEFNVLVLGGGEGKHPAFLALTNASQLLGNIGITLTVRDVADSEMMWETINTGKQELWAGSWNDSLRTVCLSPYYGISDPDMAGYIADAEKALGQDELCAAYLECFTLMTDIYAVDIPMYRKSSFSLFSSIRIDISTLPQDMTGTYDWTREIEKIKLK